MCSFPEGDQELWPEFGKKGWPGMGCLPCCRLDLPEIPFKKRHRGYDDGRDTFASAFANFKTRSGSSKHRNLAEEILKVGHAKISAQVFRFFELASSTDNFNPDYLVGEGGLGRVYKGYIESIEKVVAVKKLYRKGVQESREFFTEVLLLSLVHHPNVIDLYGYCAEGDQRILVYEFMANGSLEDHLLDLPPDKEPLDWYTRMRIAEGAAKGLEYLHEFANPVVIYRDFKASNILLDEEFNPKLSDFGLATIGPTGGKDHVSTRVMGTYGYCAPEYASTGQLTVKSDVYSFGVVLLELITGRRSVDTSRHTEEQNLVSWAQPLYKDRKRFTLVADPMLRGKYPEKGLYQALAVAAMCIQEEAATRPLMGDVVSALEYLSKPRLDEEGPMDPSNSSGEHFQSAKTETGKRKRESYGIGEAKAPAT